MTAFRPDVAVVDRAELAQEPLWADQSIITRGSSLKFVAEVVSSNWQNDYARKVEDYAALGIPEYWIADYAGLGGIRHIGKPKQPTLSVCTLVDREYEIQLLRGNQTIVSATFPGLNLTAEQILKADKSISISSGVSEIFTSSKTLQVAKLALDIINPKIPLILKIGFWYFIHDFAKLFYGDK